MKYATLCGWIIDAADERPISGAAISIDEKEMARTDADGRFKTETFPIGERRLSFTAEGYNPLSGKQNFREEGDFLLIVDEENFKPGCIPLSPIMEGTISPTSVYDLGVVNGSGEIKILAKGRVDNLLLIPYNTSMTIGNYSATLTFETDGGRRAQYLLDSLQREKRMITSAMSAEIEKETFYQRLRETEEEALRAQLGRGVPPSSGISQGIFFSQKEGPPDETQTFYKILGSNFGVEVNATRIYDSGKSYIYLDNDFLATIDQNIIKNTLGPTFDNYYDILVEAFAPVEMDVDGYPGIFYLLTELENYEESYEKSYVAGYFWGGNELPYDPYHEYGQYSNEKEILFLTTYQYKDNPTKWTEMVKSTMAHELQHLINFTNRAPRIQNYYQLDKYETETWINEGLSMVAEDIVFRGHNPDLDEQRVIPYLEAPALDSLCTWRVDPPEEAINNYPPAYMFMRYFVDHFEGSPKRLIQSNQYGLDSLVSVSGEGSFIPLFRDWLSAVYIGCQDATRRMNLEEYDYYRTLDLFKISQDNGTSLAITEGVAASSLSIPDTTGVFIEQKDLSSAQEITVSIDGSPKFKLRLLMFPSVGVSFNTLQFQLQRLR